MIRFSLVIQNDDFEFLLCEKSDADKDKYEFPGGEINTNDLPQFEVFLDDIHKVILSDVGIDICDLQKLEMFVCEEPFFVHTIFSAKILSGSPKNIKYNKVYWTSAENIDMTQLNIYGLQVMQKISECGYCHFLRQRREKLNSFFENYFSKAGKTVNF